MTQYPPMQSMPGGPARPHRGTLILVLGILGIVCCGILGIIAWVMGNSDLEAMRRGEMDRSGEALTNAGRICGMISVALWVMGIIVNIVLMILGTGFNFMSRGHP
jgi:hypothetical protein